MRKQISNKQFEIAYRSASLEFVGLYFVGLYMEAFLVRIDEIRDDLKKTKLIEEIYDNGKSFFDRGINGTRTRVNCLKRIIESGRVIEALKKVTESKHVAHKNICGFNEAKDLLKRIENGEFIIPE